jgi:hypothetical protein
VGRVVLRRHNTGGEAVLLVAMVLAVSGPCSAQTKLPDGVLYYWGCDKWGGSGWRDEAWDRGGSGHIHFDTQVKRYGAASLRLDGEPDGHVAVLSLEQPAEVTTDKQYVLQLWAKTAGVQGTAQVRALAHGPQPGEQYHPLGWVKLSDQGHLVLPADQNWTQYRIPVTTLPGGTTRIFFYLLIEGEGTVWFDEFSFSEAGVEVPLGGQAPLRDEDYAGIRLDDANLPENLLTNGGFEEGLKGWQLLPPDYSAEVDETVAHTGKCSFRFDAKEFTGGYLWQCAEIDPRRYYRISLWAKTDGLTGYFFTHLLPFNRHDVPMGWHGANHASEHHYVTGKTNGWEERVLVTRFAPEAAAVVIYPRVEDTIGTVWIDDIVIQPLPLSYEAGGEGQ